jgi:hypothetical protein
MAYDRSGAVVLPAITGQAGDANAIYDLADGTAGDNLSASGDGMPMPSKGRWLGVLIQVEEALLCDTTAFQLGLEIGGTEVGYVTLVDDWEVDHWYYLPITLGSGQNGEFAAEDTIDVDLKTEGVETVGTLAGQVIVYPVVALDQGP